MKNLIVILRDEDTFKIKLVEVDTVKEASEKVLENTSVLGSSDWYGFDDCEEKVGSIYHRNRVKYPTPLCEISYNGKVWDNSKERKSIDENISFVELIKIQKL